MKRKYAALKQSVVGTVLREFQHEDTGQYISSKDIFLQPGDDEENFWNEWRYADLFEDGQKAEEAKQRLIADYFVTG